MKNITLSADEHLIEKARAVARSQRKTLNAVFREWLRDYTTRAANVQDHLALMERLKHWLYEILFCRKEDLELLCLVEKR